MSARPNFQFFSGASIRARKPLRQFTFREVQEDLDDLGAVAMQAPRSWIQRQRCFHRVFWSTVDRAAGHHVCGSRRLCLE